MKLLINSLGVLKILGWAFFVFLAAIIQTAHFLSFLGVNPNLILLLIFLPLILEKEFLKALILVLTTLVLVFIFLPFWFKEILILGGLAIIGLFLKKFLTGRELWDFLILVFSGTLGFYLINNFYYLINNPVAVIVELFYNAVLGILMVFLITKFSKNQ